MRRYRTLVEDELFTAQVADLVAELGDVRYIDDALTAVTWALSMAFIYLHDPLVLRLDI
jgi:hypothetical protein